MNVDGSLLDRFDYSMIMLIQHLVHPSYIYEPNLWHNLLWWCQIKQKTFCLMAMISCISTRGVSFKRRGTLGLWQVKSINTLINIYDNLQRSISVIYLTHPMVVIAWVSRQENKCSQKILLCRILHRCQALSKWWNIKKPEIRYQSLAHLGKEEPEWHEDSWS